MGSGLLSSNHVTILLSRSLSCRHWNANAKRDRLRNEESWSSTWHAWKWHNLNIGHVSTYFVCRIRVTSYPTTYIHRISRNVRAVWYGYILSLNSEHGELTGKRLTASVSVLWSSSMLAYPCQHQSMTTTDTFALAQT